MQAQLEKKTAWNVLRKLRIDLLHELALPPLGTRPKEKDMSLIGYFHKCQGLESTEVSTIG